MLRIETVEPDTLSLLKELVLMPELADFNLVGGTALSLIIGHRISYDLDFFTSQNFDVLAIVKALEAKYLPHLAFTSEPRSSMLFANIKGVKVDFIADKSTILKLPSVIEEIRFASLEDICAMKLNAITGRGAKKDFFDLAELLDLFSISEMMGFFKSKFHHTQTIHVLKSLNYFEDAEHQTDIISLSNKSWHFVKKTISEALKKHFEDESKKIIL
ncbi:MAG: nucleotidyl transferase AbiEii/AbiGii toxin family protein [Cytophagales bacterium]